MLDSDSGQMMDQSISPNDSPFLLCPNCNSAILYVEDDGDGLVFFRISLAGDFVPTDLGRPVPGDARSRRLNCVGCAWHGTLDELLEAHARRQVRA